MADDHSTRLHQEVDPGQAPPAGPGGGRATIGAVPPFAAYFRVYEPLVAFDRARQQYWRRYVTAGRGVSQTVGPARQRRLVMEALGAGWTRLPELPDEAYVITDEGATLVCPWNLQIQVARSALSARSGVPVAIADAFVPPALVGASEQAVAAWRSDARGVDDTSPRLHEFTSGWAVPLRWFTFVEHDERRVSLTPGDRYVRYRTSMARARRRAHRALAVLRRTMPGAPMTEAVEEGSRWLEEFHPRSLVELDYGGLAYLMGDRELLDDDSPRLVAEALVALGRSDVQEAGHLYERLVERWRNVQLYERRN